MEKQIVGLVHSTENFGTVDGPGIRFVIFLQGCRMRCQFCHNPDTWAMKTKTTREVSSNELLAEALKFQSYWGDDGGITVSGGEPLLQMDFLLELFTKAKEKGIHTTLDTCGQPFVRNGEFFEKLNRLLKVTDLILYDIKEMNSTRHETLTGHSNEKILEFATYLSEIEQPVWIRHVLIPTKTDFDEDLAALDAFIRTLANVEKVEILPYHTMGEFKWKELGIAYPLEGIAPPNSEQVEHAKKMLHIG